METVTHTSTLPGMVGSLCDLLHQAALVTRRVVIAEDDESGTYPGQMRLIARIRLDGSSTINQLAREIGVRPAVVSRMIRRFTEIGYVEARSVGRRGAPVVLTAMGRSARPLALPAGDLDAHLTRGMSDHEVEQLRRLLTVIIQQNVDPGRPDTGRSRASASLTP
jgi:DNA-binding MarR family transcriptional regulator